jgi:hypothetical protein
MTAADSTPRARRRGIAPATLLEQVRNTASWALTGGDTAAAGTASWRQVLLDGEALQARWQAPEAHAEYLRLLLAAHFATVATFVPTDVDAQIRHHLWQELHDPEALRLAMAIVDEAAAWDPGPVSARVLDAGRLGAVSGHAGEWFSVRAGALGRALQLGARDVVEALVERVDAELEREATAHAEARRAGDAVLALSLATTVAHNTGDLSRVVDAWPASTPEREAFVSRYVRLGHGATSRFGSELALAGHVNKQLMAADNHRFLALRTPRALRTSRELLVPIGPFFDAWGERIGSWPGWSSEQRGEVVAALVQGVDRGIGRHGYQRALAGIHRSAPGGLDALVGHLPARLRHHLQRGPIREALRVEPEHFAVRMEKAWRAALAGAAA